MSSVPRSERYENIPTALVYDIFAELATQLTGRYIRLSDTAPSAAERDQWWQKALELRQYKRAVPARDRAALIAHISQWEAELSRLRGAHCV
ncbi:hypothetical protein C0R01_23910 [Streptomyces albidoflavus]|uniref:hypothetical protein n=1 Tax=Streptomyces albidoflavus TaxID=1886 RepID=UPI00101E5FC2|nr:hypothetical protein [Streptomyces albidoflavus]MCX4468474.1 hypothetical protein [Streptomyces albidoflavus]RZE54771.1 hypothetical protein C0R00_31520 [Streptomyces albidoflavus]RZE71098.1 hypothetical protein C0R01_23910 [Streptomyces albidoflavus]WTC39943.1 hypothetical protein OH723_31755 [Streptomyces albidoflavus]